MRLLYKVENLSAFRFTSSYVFLNHHPQYRYPYIILNSAVEGSNGDYYRQIAIIFQADA